MGWGVKTGEKERETVVLNLRLNRETVAAIMRFTGDKTYREAAQTLARLVDSRILDLLEDAKVSERGGA